MFFCNFKKSLCSIFHFPSNVLFLNYVPFAFFKCWRAREWGQIIWQKFPIPFLKKLFQIWFCTPEVNYLSFSLSLFCVMAKNIGWKKIKLLWKSALVNFLTYIYNLEISYFILFSGNSLLPEFKRVFLCSEVTFYLPFVFGVMNWFIKFLRPPDSITTLWYIILKSGQNKITSKKVQYMFRNINKIT